MAVFKANAMGTMSSIFSDIKMVIYIMIKSVF